MDWRTKIVAEQYIGMVQHVNIIAKLYSGCGLAYEITANLDLYTGYGLRVGMVGLLH